MAVLESLQVCKEYGGSAAVRVQALRGVDMRVEAGEFLAIMGQSGSGKSTLLHVLGGIDPPTAGRVLLDGRDFGTLSDTERSIVRRRRIGFVFQKMNLLPTLSALENVALPLRIDGARRGAAEPPAQGFGARWPGASRGAFSSRALGRRAAARGHRAGPGDPAGRGVGRRADRCAR